MAALPSLPLSNTGVKFYTPFLQGLEHFYKRVCLLPLTPALFSLASQNITWC